MTAMLLTGHGGVDKLVLRHDVPVPRPGQGELLIKVTATAKNNTDRKVREGLYASKDKDEVTSFQSSLTFPRIQGADVVGRVAAVGDGVDPARIGERVLMDFNIYADDRRDIYLIPDYIGHGSDGGFAEYTVAPADQCHAVDKPDLADAELAALGMCSYQTAYHMLTVANVAPGERVLVSGASGGVGTALIQLCRIIGAVPYALSTRDKADALKALGAEAVLDRADIGSLTQQVRDLTGGAPIDAVMDLIGGDMTLRFIDTMVFDMARRTTYPRLSIAGASGGNVSEMLWALIYVNQVQIFGVSHGTRAEIDPLMDWIRSGQLKPVLHGTFRLSDLHEAEHYFANRGSSFIGKIVVVPDAEWAEHGARFEGDEAGALGL
jgi:NADPH:quinone reductase-like Zn-dependent oxidoreductase